ncbi:hypothetical protein SAMN05216387_10949 [Nitrosovibrio tenuis]|uniref:Uncharacterized protein n=1 Tax=Nitrosovibrio tenuis TaxID=1233 RepID=A0A1H7PJ21_9PROT|nr:hypothetical protein SAMN05216387_10949 [Nitrosovibrio tenuis]
MRKEIAQYLLEIAAVDPAFKSQDEVPRELVGSPVYRCDAIPSCKRISDSHFCIRGSVYENSSPLKISLGVASSRDGFRARRL